MCLPDTYDPATDTGFLSTAEVRSFIRTAWDYRDPYGSTMAFWFEIADELYFNRDGYVPDHWDYHPGAGNPSDSDDEMSEWTWLVRHMTDEQLVRFGNLMARVYDRCKAAGLDY